jgi:hypothetical protein
MSVSLSSSQHVLAGPCEGPAHLCAVALHIGPIGGEDIVGPSPEQQVVITREQRPDCVEYAVVAEPEQQPPSSNPPV